MQMLDINTASPPLSVVRIEVERLFGKYTYSLAKKDNNPHIDSSLIILYGDNGSGKTTILKLLFHLLSTGNHRGHRTFLAKTPFAKFSVFLADRTSIIASRVNGTLIGSFRLQLSQENNIIFTEDIQAESDNRIQAIQDYLPGYEFYQNISQLQLSLFLLGDNRVLNSDIFETEDIQDERQLRRMILSNIGNPLDDKYSINRKHALKTSIHRTEEWIRDQALKGANQGEANVHNIYEEIITRILQTSGSLVEEELSQSTEMLISELKAHEDRSKDFSRFGLMPPLETQKIVNILKSNTKTDSSIISRVLKPYLDSVTGRFDALQDTQSLLTIFETTINKLFFRDKYIRLHVRDGLKIFTEEGKELSPETLSSGEKQLLLLFCNTLTARDKATIFIIDEPEISLNIKWQRQLIRALLELTKGSQVQFILATHSIELLSQYNNNVVKLVKLEK
ncbi:ATP-binding protein [Desmonostoc muscorum LEGE 12446]|uniref:ATP-binding protein n=1 Tax=Desmonostoc muscorum LEGE 12446 TaxID=1828758 RepID=A0A8J7ADV2_DESMC|nr:AAA family ATPase [Desmonostoc muscorum]MCF2150556.1 ATP-binding protein [Desmonostoc muscorum LEGE 12446]